MPHLHGRKEFFMYLLSRKIAQWLTTLLALTCCALGLCAAYPSSSAYAAASPGQINVLSAARHSAFGPNVYIFTPSMPQSQIQSTLNTIANQQVGNQFGTQRYALLFAPGTYGSSATPLNFQVGYYTSVAGLGRSPTDVVINGSIDVYNQCSGTNCTALVNFWRSLSNLTINVNTPNAGCYNGEFWAVSQAARGKQGRLLALTLIP